MIDDDGKKKPFVYYPRKVSGKPPYMYKSKERAEKELSKMKKGLYANDDIEVVKYEPQMYLDRY
jgi:hypothetical protein